MNEYRELILDTENVCLQENWPPISGRVYRIFDIFNVGMFL